MTHPTQAQIDAICATATPAPAASSGSSRRGREGQCNRVVRSAMTAATVRLRPAALARLMKDHDDLIEFVEVRPRTLLYGAQLSA